MIYGNYTGLKNLGLGHFGGHFVWHWGEGAGGPGRWFFGRDFSVRILDFLGGWG
jgi:hypothetical protein